MYVCMYVCMYVGKYVRLCMYSCECVRAYMYPYMMYVCMYVGRMYVRMKIDDMFIYHNKQCIARAKQPGAREMTDATMHLTFSQHKHATMGSCTMIENAKI